VEVGEGPLLLRVESTAESYKFSFAPDGGAWVALGSGDERQIASEIANVWSGMYLAMFSVSPEGERGSPADFDWLDYKSN
jgi:beta-xylosidase